MGQIEVIKEITQREFDSGLFNIKINDINIYNYINREIQTELLKYYGWGLNYQNPIVPDKERKKALYKSFWQFVSLFLSNKKYDIVIRSFERVDFINGKYIDKFTDPLIDYSDIGKNCVIFEHGRSGRHLTPRYHSNMIIFTDIIYWLAWKFITLRKRYYYRKHSQIINELFSKIDKTFPEITINKDKLFTHIVRSSFITSCYKTIFKKIHATKLFAPARASFKHIVPAAKICGLKVFELQHGLTYSLSITYAGHQDSLFSPDLFLSFGKIHSANSYGIQENKIIEIGWAFEKYLTKQIEKSKDSILIVSAPDISEKMISITCYFAKKHPEIHFYFRPHPLEVLDDITIKQLKLHKNIFLSDNLENISMVLMRFDCVLGSNSTVLYEALAMDKKVGKLNMYGLIPQFLKKEDEKFFYIINDDKSFDFFYHSPIDLKSSINIYSPFKPEVINRLLVS